MLIYISERGNIEFKKENYKEAVKFFEAAITFDDQQYLFLKMPLFLTII